MVDRKKDGVEALQREVDRKNGVEAQQKVMDRKDGVELRLAWC